MLPYQHVHFGSGHVKNGDHGDSTIVHVHPYAISLPIHSTDGPAVERSRKVHSSVALDTFTTLIHGMPLLFFRPESSTTILAPTKSLICIEVPEPCGHDPPFTGNAVPRALLCSACLNKPPACLFGSRDAVTVGSPCACREENCEITFVFSRQTISFFDLSPDFGRRLAAMRSSGGAHFAGGNYQGSRFTRRIAGGSGRRVSAARGLESQSRLIPNPTFEFENQNLRPGQTYSADVDTYAYLTQPLDILGKEKTAHRRRIRWA